jgi:hypothetical protein
MSLHTLIIALKGGQNFTLTFNDAESALAAASVPTDPHVAIADHYGNKLWVQASEVSTVCMMDDVAAVEANMERSLIQGRAQAKMQQRAQADPVLNGTLVSPGSGMPFLGRRQ